MQRLPVVIAGGSLSGYSTAKFLRQVGFDGPIILFGQEANLPYERPPLSKSFLLDKTQKEQVYLTNQENLNDLNIEFMPSVLATGLDSASKKIFINNGDAIGYDALVIATGAAPKVPLGVKLDENILTFRTLEDAQRLKSAVERKNHLIILGAGFIGVELASSVSALGGKVTLVDMVDSPLEPVLGPEFAQLIKAHLLDAGVVLKMGNKFKQLLSSNDEVSLIAQDDSEILGDYCVVATGVTPQTEWVKDNHIALVNGISCNQFLQATKDVFAVGDVARFDHIGLNSSMRIEHYVNATGSAQVVAHNIVNETPKAYLPVPYFWSEFFNIKIQMLGVSKPYDSVLIIKKGSDEIKGTVVLYSNKGKVTAIAAVSKPRLFGLVKEIVQNQVPVVEAEKIVRDLI
jgi:NADPH-dependent 2,4-dienoyl-CoA reductase/sulfur reductase-like enzyme